MADKLHVPFGRRDVCVGPNNLEIATNAEAITGTATDKIVTPANLAGAAGTHVPAASETVQGKVELATTVEAAAGADTARAVTAAGLAAYCPAASETAQGKVELATTVEAAAGTDTARAVTAAGLAAYCPAASETAQGKVELATTVEAAAGTDAERAVTAAGLAAYCPAASDTAAGKIELATSAEAKAGTSTTRAVTPANLTQGQTVAAGTLQAAFLQHYQTAPALGTATYVHAAITLADGATTVVTTAITNPDVPRVVTVKGNAAGIAGNVVIDGTNIDDEVIQDTIIAADATEVSGIMAFKTVTSITVPARTAPGDTISVGVDDIFGMPHIIHATGCLLAKLFNLATDAGTLAVDDDEVEKNLFTIAGTPDGAKLLDLYYLV